MCWMRFILLLNAQPFRQHSWIHALSRVSMTFLQLQSFWLGYHMLPEPKIERLLIRFSLAVFRAHYFVLIDQCQWRISCRPFPQISLNATPGNIWLVAMAKADDLTFVCFGSVWLCLGTTRGRVPDSFSFFLFIDKRYDFLKNWSVFWCLTCFWRSIDSHWSNSQCKHNRLNWSHASFCF